MLTQKSLVVIVKGSDNMHFTSYPIDELRLIASPDLGTRSDDDFWMCL